MHKLLEKYIWLVLLFFLIAPNFLEPIWFWRWFSILLFYIVFMAIFAWGYYAWLILKRDPVSLTSTSREQYQNLNPSQRKWHLGIFYLTIFLGGPFILYMAFPPLVDTVRAISSDNYVQTADIMVVDRTTAMGAWFVGQSLKIEGGGIPDGNLLLMFSFKHALEGERYEVKYLPYSGLILELNEI